MWGRVEWCKGPEAGVNVLVFLGTEGRSLCLGQRGKLGKEGEMERSNSEDTKV